MTQILKLEKWNPQIDGDFNEANFRKKLETRNYRVTRYVYPPGTCFTAHAHSVDKIDGVLSGRFRMQMYNQTVILEAGDSLRVPKGAIHSAEVVGDQIVVRLDAIRQD